MALSNEYDCKTSVWLCARTVFLLIFLAACHCGTAYAAGIPGRLSGPYVAGHLFTATLAVFCRSSTRAVRWVAGFACTVALAGFKTAALMPALGGEIGLGGKMLAYAASALWECSNAALVFGGEALQSSFQISGYRRALVTGLIPCQVRFVNRSQSGRTLRRCVHLSIWFLGGFLFRGMLRSSAALENVAMASPILEAEAMAVLASVAVLVCNLPAIFCQIAMDIVLRFWPNDSDFRVLVILPYGAILLSTCSRDFWNRWSRPATQLIRQMLYHPLGGANRPWLSIPAMFAINAISHYDVSKTLVGDRAEMSWNVAFGVLGCAALIETFAVRRLRSSGTARENGEEPDGGTTVHCKPRTRNSSTDTEAPRSLQDEEDVDGPRHERSQATGELAAGSEPVTADHARADRSLSAAPRDMKFFIFVLTHTSLVFALYVLMTHGLKMRLTYFL